MSLFIVATPIGNLKDISFRAIEILRSVDLVAAEDTRTAKKLFTKFDIHTPLTSFHAHSTDRATEKLIKKMKSGKSVALISEAGTPGISDPGFALIRKAIEAGIEIVPIPGACAAVAALSASGLRMDKFLFLGFLPRKKGRKKLFASLREDSTKELKFWSEFIVVLNAKFLSFSGFGRPLFRGYCENETT